MAAQQEELALKYAADDARLRLNQFERALSVALTGLTQNPSGDLVAAVGLIADGRLLFPWDFAPVTPKFDPRFDAALSVAEADEYRDSTERALSGARGALTVAANPAQRSRAKLVLARLLAKTRRDTEAERTYRELLEEPLMTTDGMGVPFALYAAERLASAGRLPDTASAVQSLLTSAADSATPLPPVGWYLLRSAARGLRAGATGAQALTLSTVIDERLADIEQALALQREFGSFAGVLRASERTWLPYGARPWLVGTATPVTGHQRAVAVRVDRLVASVHVAHPHLAGLTVAPTTSKGEWLGDAFPGVKVATSDRIGRAPQVWHRGFFAGALGVVLSVTLLGGFLLWRDVQRDSRLAELRSQFVSSVSHELRTPLTAIRMFAETMRRGGVNTATRDEYLDTIVNESERLTRLLNNVLDFSQIEQGRKAYRFEMRSLTEILNIAARAMAYPLEQHGFALKLQVDDSLPPVRVDSDALQQAILNLLTNAMKYSGDGREIDLRLTAGGAGDAVISVADRGPGIPAHERHRIFEKFYRVPTAEISRIPGTGLGLTLVDHIVKAHGGTVRLESAPGQGSTFSIHLPLKGVAA